jgi:hypothetical protein
VLSKVHLRSRYLSHATRRPPRLWTTTGRHANQRCQCMADDGRFDGISYKNARVETAVPLGTLSSAVIMCAVQERQYSPLVSEPRPATAPNRSPRLTMPLMSITFRRRPGAFMTPQLWQAAAARLQSMLFSLDPRGARTVQYCIARARGADEDLDREMELISFLCDHNLSADWRREAAISHLRPFV